MKIFKKEGRGGKGGVKEEVKEEVEKEVDCAIEGRHSLEKGVEVEDTSEDDYEHGEALNLET